MQTAFVFPHSTFAFSNFFTQITPATPIVIAFVFFTAFRSIKKYCPTTLNKMFCMTTSKEVTKVLEESEVELLPYSRAMQKWQLSAFNHEYFRDVNRLGMVKPVSSKHVNVVHHDYRKDPDEDASRLKIK